MRNNRSHSTSVWVAGALLAVLAAASPRVTHGQGLVVRGAKEALALSRGAEQLSLAIEALGAGTTRDGRMLLRLLETQKPEVLASPEVKELFEAMNRGEVDATSALFRNDPALRAVVLEQVRATRPVRLPPCTGANCGLAKLTEEINAAARQAVATEAFEGVQAWAIRSAFEQPNEWTPFLTEITTAQELAEVDRLVSKIARTPEEADLFLERFYKTARDALARQPEETKAYLDALPANWHKEYEVYYTYPGSLKYGGAPDDPATLFDLARAQGLDSNPYSLYVAPFWSGPGPGGRGVDGGFDVAKYEVAEIFGGEAGLDALLGRTRSLGVPVIGDVIPNHVSIQHEWMQALRSGDLSMADRFIQVPEGWEKVGEESMGGRMFAVYRNTAGETEKTFLYFPHDARDNFLIMKVGEGDDEVRLFHTFYRSQVDVNHRNPDVFQYFLDVEANMINRGIAGLRIDAAQHVVKVPEGFGADPEATKAWLATMNRFAKIVGRGKVKLFPEIGSDVVDAVPYLGKEIELTGAGRVPSISDGIWGFQARSRLPETVVGRDARPFWAFLDEIPESTPQSSTIFAMDLHHDELPAEFMLNPRKTLPLLLERGVPFRDGAGVSGRMLPMVGGDERQLELMWALKTVGIPKSTPILYYGEEGALGNDFAHAARQAELREQLMREQGLELSDPFDSRDVHRQVVDFAGVRDVERTYAPSQIYRKLLDLRRTRPSLRSTSRPIRLSTGDDEVIAMIRYTGSGRDTPVLFVVNLGAESKTIRIRLRKLEGGMTWTGNRFQSSGTFETLLSNAVDGSPPAYRLTDEFLEIDLGAETFTLADIPIP